MYTQMPLNVRTNKDLCSRIQFIFLFRFSFLRFIANLACLGTSASTQI